ncbi:MAG: hypothetical protein ACLU30_00820 [Odoribacter splanchnicus]
MPQNLKSGFPDRTFTAYPASKRKLESRDLENPDYFRTTLIELHIGEEVWRCCRKRTYPADSPRRIRKIPKHRQQLEQFVQQTIDSHPALLCSIEWTEPFAANENDPESATWIQEAAQSNGLTYKETDHPLPGEKISDYSLNIFQVLCSVWEQASYSGPPYSGL